MNDPSPTTEGMRPSWPATRVSTYGQSRRAQETQRGPLATVPQNEQQCDLLLEAATARLRQSAITASDCLDLARFPGASSRAWNADRRAKLRVILAGAGRIAVGPLLEAAAASPREEVLDETVRVLRMIAEKDAEVGRLAVFTLMPGLANVDGRPSPIVAESAPLRAVLVRLLGELQSHAAPTLRLAALSSALDDASPLVRDAAVQAWAAVGDRRARVILQRHRAKETEDFIRAQIDVALEDVR